MEIEFDPIESARNEANAALDSGSRLGCFVGRTVEVVDDRHEYGELRVRAIGEVEGDVLVVTYTDRDGVRRIISARDANREERVLWQSYE